MFEMTVTIPWILAQFQTLEVCEVEEDLLSQTGQPVTSETDGLYVVPQVPQGFSVTIRIVDKFIEN